MKKIEYITLFLILFLNYYIEVNSCPNGPKPIKINQNDPLLLETYKKIDQYLDKNLKLNNISNFISTIVYMDEIVWSKTYGNINPVDDHSPPLTLDTNFRIASCTKMFTSLMMMQFRDKGKINSIDDEIKNYFPKFKINDIHNMNGEKRGITFRELASHTSGLPRETPCDPNYYGTTNCTEDIILDRLSKQFLLSNEYKRVHYSNVGFSLLGRTLGEVYKKANDKHYEPTTEHPQIYYEKYVTKEILAKLNMSNSTYDPTKLDQNNIAISYYIDSNGEKKLIPNTLSGWNSPGGGLYSTARDMCSFMKFILNGNQDIIQDSTRNEYLTSVSLLSNGVQAFGIPFEMFYGNSTGTWFKGKNGLIGGYHSQLTMAADLKLGIFSVSMIDTNGDLFTREILEMLIPVYESLIIEELEKKHIQPINEHDLFVYKVIIGKYNSSFGESFMVEFDDTLNILFGYFQDTPSTLYAISNFDEDNTQYSYIKRLNLYNYQNATCSSMVCGPNEELIYFNLIKDSNGSIKDCDGLDILGLSLKKVY
ncbi:hypothetical protein DICPUDRAFT_84366 [Dictyostelium purpureum]|uniref:Beta-lactamase-related domain-containing protein n=1 Tax=Dictyostelium purpureum TaxID=5786 RepID=F1A2F5_DICPU|nr:uncharacterized protein DICPUDRAFT_84366 [Dictyostelium purpureum]EGC29616.1 hypothetical protein DICPUDRAFT_84366 [Dictyostelium purpureum]|eukprot:XP_003293849.1 hypothetical protein DICPUDRAFT_84366 [Dictyostelium purpureum]